MSTLSDDDAQKLFQEVSQSIRENNTSKLDELIEVKPAEGNPETEEAPAVTEEAPQETEQTQEAPSSDEGTQEQSPPETAEEQPEKPEAKTPDELATLKEQLEAIKKENHHLKSQAGRMPHMQSKVKELDKKLEELRTRLSSPSSQPSTKIKPVLQAKLDKLRETDPELADIIEASATAASDGTASELINAEIAHTEALRKAEYEAYHKAQWDHLVEEVPNAPDIFKGKHWAEWKAGKSKVWQTLASSDEAEDVIAAIREYEKDMLAKYPELAKPQEVATPPATTTPDAAAAEKAKQIEAARQKSKQSSVTTGTPTAPAQVSTPSDAASLFKKYSEEIRKSRLG